MDPDAIISVRGLTAAYGEEVILKDISFEVKRGEVFVILGGSGSGKSTLLKHLIGLFPLVAGEVRIEGDNLATAAGGKRQKILRRFGVAYQSGALFGSMTLKENVSLPLEEFTRLPVEARRRHFLDEAEVGRVGELWQPLARRSQWGHAKAGGHRPSHGSGPGGAIPGRALRGARSDHLRRA